MARKPESREHDEDLMQGHPAQEEDDRQPDERHSEEDTGSREAPAPKMVDVTIGGRQFQLEESAAAALQAQQETFQEELAKMRETPHPSQSAASDEGGDDSEEDELLDLMLSNPREYHNRLKKEIRDEVRGEYIEEQSRKAFWDLFYEENDDLVPYKTIVNAVLQERFDEFGNMKGKQAIKPLGDAVREVLMGIAGSKFKSGKKSAANTLEGSGSSASGSSGTEPENEGEGKESEDEKPLSLSQILKERKKTKGRVNYPSAGTAS